MDFFVMDERHEFFSITLSKGRLSQIMNRKLCWWGNKNSE
jgi:hypothetical protein